MLEMIEWFLKVVFYAMGMAAFGKYLNLEYIKVMVI